MIGDHACHHGFADRDRADADARIVTAGGRYFCLMAVAVDCTPRRENRRGRLDGKTGHDWLPGGNAAKNAAGIVGEKAQLAVVAYAHLIAVLFPAELGRAEAGADFDAFDGIDAHQRRGEVTVELAVDRRAEAGRDTFSDDLDDRPDRRAFLAQVVEIIAKHCSQLGIGTEERILVDLVPVPPRAIDPMRAHLDQSATNFQIRNDFTRDGACGYTHCGLACRLPAAAAIIAQAIFNVVGEVGVAGTVFILYGRIVFRALIEIVDHKRNRRASRDLRTGDLVNENAGNNPNGVRLLALRRVARLSGPSAIKIGLDVGFAKRNARRTAVNHAADRRTVAFTKGRYTEQVAESIERHDAAR